MQTPIKIAPEDKSSESDIDNLKKWLTTQPHLPPVPENMLHVFHHSCFSDLNRTKHCIDTYYSIRSNTPEVFKNRNLDDENLKMTSENTLNFIIPKTSPEGYRILFQRIESTDSSKYIFESACKFFFLGLDSLIHEEGIYPGYMILLDYKNVRLGHLTKTSIGSMRKMFKYLQEGSPMRLKSIHMINMNFFVDKVMSFVKPFMAKDLYNLIHFYPEGQLSKLYEHIPLDCLPSDYGGKLPSCDILYGQVLKKLESYDEYFKKEEVTFSVNEKLRPSCKKSKKKKDDENDISLKTLELD